MECPPRSKKLSPSWIWLAGIFNNVDQTCLSEFCNGVRSLSSTVAEVALAAAKAVSGNGSAFLSILPFGVRGILVSGTNTDGTA